MTRKIAMTIIRTVLAMLNCGFSYSKIRHYTGASNGFINKLASAARSDLEAFLKLSDGEIYERVYPKTQTPTASRTGRSSTIFSRRST